MRKYYIYNIVGIVK